MFSARNQTFVANLQGPRDPFFANVIGLFDGGTIAGVDNQTILDSTGTFTAIKGGQTTQGTFSPFNPTVWSNSFNGSGDRLTLNNSAVALGTSPFCIEFWMFNNVLKNYSTGVTTRPDSTSYSDAYHIGWDSVGGISLYIGTTSSPNAAPGTVKTNTWQHFVCCRDSNNITSLYIDGIRLGTATITANLTRQLLGIGDFATTASQGINGYLSNVRIVKGNPVYDPTQTYLTVPTQPLTAVPGTVLLTCQSNRFIENSNNYALSVAGTPTVQSFSPFVPLTKYSPSTISGSFYSLQSNMGGYQLSPNSSGLLGSGSAFTVDLWFYPDTAVAGTLWTGGTNSIQLGYQNTGSFGLAENGVAWLLTSSTVPTVGMWNHVALSRSGTGAGQTSIWLNGTRIVNGQTTSAFTAPAYSGGDLNAFVSNFRYTPGSALYNPSATTIPVPTTPQIPVAGTVGLLNFTNAGIIDYAGRFNIRTAGTVVTSPITPFGIGTSMKFNGTDSVLQIQKYYGNFGSNSFTVECWINPTTISSNQYIWYAGNGGGNVPKTYVQLNSNGTLEATVTLSGGASNIVSTATASTNVWQHLAFVRNGTAMNLYLNGISIGSATNSVNLAGIANFMQIGQFADGAGGYYNGLIYNFRISYYARYTSNFAPSTTPFPTY